MDTLQKVSSHFSKSYLSFACMKEEGGVKLSELDSEAVGRRIKECLRRNHMTQEALSNMVGMPKSTLNGYCMGSRKIDTERVSKIAKVLGVSVHYLITGQLISNDTDLEEEFMKLMEDPQIRDIYDLITQLTPEALEVAKEHIAVIVKHQNIEKK